jgi:hypothetical protein
MLSARHMIDSAVLGEDRPYVDLYWSHLIEEAESAWDDAIILFCIWSEATHRVRRNPASRAQNVVDRVEPRLIELVKDIFPPEPDPPPGDGDFVEPDIWPKVGLLRYMGYTVGQDDPGTPERRRILRQVFLGPIPKVVDVEYMQQWGKDKSPTRLRKLAWSIASFANNRLRANDGETDAVTEKWRADLKWLRKEFYEGYFRFPWPVPEIKWRT